MKNKQLLLQTLEEWQEISGLDFCLLTPDGEVYLPAKSHKAPAPDKIDAFIQQDACAKASATQHYYKVMKKDDVVYVLVVWGKGTQAHTIGELAVCQIRSLLDKQSDRPDKNTFIQNLLLGNYNSVDMYNHAKSLHINEKVPRAVFLVESKKKSQSSVLATMQSIFGGLSGNYVVGLNDELTVMVQKLSEKNTYEDLQKTADTLVDMIGAEAMTAAWVAYGNIAEDLSQLTNAYQEAMTSLEVGKIFTPELSSFGYRHLGIGHLIYRLPPDICQMFVEDTLKGEDFSEIDEETLILIKTFFENNLNLSETARQLYLHRNTLVYRLEKLEKRFGLDIRTFEDAITFKLVMMIINYTKYLKK